VATPSKTVIDVPGADGTNRRLTLTNLDKVLYPATGFTKAAVIDYYAKVAPVLLPHLRRRALTMVRWPDGVDGGSFFAKRRPSHAPEWLGSAPAEGGLVGCVIDDLPSLVWVANLAALELHTHQATVDAPDAPTSLVLDLDPGAPAGILECARVALELRDLLERLGLAALVKTSGSKGVHVAVPVRATTAEATKTFARALGGLLADAHPDRVTIAMAREQRHGRVFVDWSQNDRAKTTVAPYSLRARARPLVSAPVTWSELSDALDSATPEALELDAATVLDRVARLGDPYAENLTAARELPVLG
jgi:bifunctional non-homologous end joining protein LigD